MKIGRRKWALKYSRLSLGYKLPIFISLLIIAVLAGTSVLMFTFGADLLLVKSKDEMKANADRMGENLSNLVEMENQIIYLVSVHQEFEDLLKLRASGTLSDDQFFSSQNPLYKQTIETLEQSMKQAKGKLSFAILDKEGTIVASSNPESLNTSRSDRDYYQQAIKGESYISDVLQSKSTGKFIVVFAIPIFDDNGNVLGICYSSIETNSFIDKFQDVKINQEGVVYIASRNGTIIYHSGDDAKVGQVLDSAEWMKLKEVTVSKEIVRGELDMQQSYIRYSKIPYADWTVVVEDTYVDITRPLDSLSAQIWLVTLCAVVIAIVVGILISRLISVPIKRLTQLFKQMAMGDLTVTASGRYEGELQQLATSFNEMAENNKQLLYNMNTSIVTLKSSTSNMEQSSSSTTRAVQETAITVMEIARSMDLQANDTNLMANKFVEMGSKIDSIDKSSHTIKERSEAIVQIFHSSNEVIEKLIDTSHRNEQEVAKIHKTMSKLAESSSQIRNITGAMTDIASQTNLLALNASIEAARAGEHGRGFGVVANEIRKLAEQSTKQSEEIQAIISETLLHMEDNNKSVRDIQGIVTIQEESVEQAQQAFNVIFNHIIDISEQIKNLANEAMSIKQDNDDVMGAVHSLSSSGEEVLAATEEVTATVQEQSEMVRQLANMVETIDSLTKDLVQAASRFKVE
ncbi:methyl-accepting chemotaxis protein [Paenibacillus sp. GCM10027627]|uniref:methyl-accepting chemotaxis protein n=1 Tax=unclassified Paenibacillus TaxID=185978 RepID=UPI0036428C45